MNKLIPLTLLLLIVATGAEATGRWKVGPAPAGTTTRAFYDPNTGNPNGVCYWDANDTGPDQCRYKSFSTTPTCRFVTETAPNQCTPGQTPPPAPVKTEWVRFEGTRAHVYSYDGTMQFDDYVDGTGAKTLSWKQSTDVVSIVLTSAGLTVTRNGATVRTSSTVKPTDAQMQAMSTMLTNSVAVARFRLNTATKLSAAKARLLTLTTVSNTARGVEIAFFDADALVAALMGDKAAFDRHKDDPAPGGNGNTQRDCVTDYEAAVYRYGTMFDECDMRARQPDPGKAYDWDRWIPPGDLLCVVEFGVRADGAMFQLFRCMLGG